ncbi:hypothetical protein [Corynebacterium urogenitale]
MSAARINPPAGNQGEKEQHGANKQFTSNNTSRRGHINLDCELSVLRCLMSAPAAGVLQAVKDCGLVEQDFHAEHRRVIYRAVMETARQAVQAGQGSVHVSPMEVMSTLQRRGEYNPAVSTDFVQASAGDSMSGSVANLWVLARRVETLKLQRMWRGVEHLGTLFLDLCGIASVEHLDKALEQVEHLQALRNRLADPDNAGEVA